MKIFHSLGRPGEWIKLKNKFARPDLKIFQKKNTGYRAALEKNKKKFRQVTKNISTRKEVQGPDSELASPTCVKLVWSITRERTELETNG